MTLKDGKTGMELKIAEIGDSALKERLMTMGLIPGTKVQVLRSAPLGELLALAAIFILAVTAFCFFFTAFFPAELPFIRAVILYPVPSFIFSGYTWPTESMGEGMQLASQFFPLSHFSNTVRELFLIGSSPHYWESIEKLTALAIGFFLIGGLLYHQRLKKSRVIVHQTC